MRERRRTLGLRPSDLVTQRGVGAVVLDNSLTPPMVSRKKLDDGALAEALRSLPHWTESPDRPAIVRRFQFADFSTAWAFMTRLALVAEKLDHHPEWFNVYGRVDILLTTHDADGISELDVQFARLADEYAEQTSKPSPA